MHSIPVFPGPHEIAFPAGEGKEPGQCFYGTVSEMLRFRANKDAHFAAYSYPELSHRLKREAIGQAKPRMVLAVFDVDAPEHNAMPEWRAEQGSKITSLLSVHSGGFVYTTRGGYRLVYGTDYLIEDAADERTWTALYGEWCRCLEDRFGIVADTACADWTRLYRIPYATRDGVPQEPDVYGDPEHIGTWSPEISSEASARILAARDAVAEAFQDDGEAASDEVLGFARAYAAKAPPAVQGQGGSSVTIRLAGDLWHGFALNQAQTLEVMATEWNPRCEPPWEIDGTQGLRRKVSEATKGTYTESRGHRVVAHQQWERFRGLAPKAGSDPGRYFKCTDLGNAERLVHEHGADLRYCQARRIWFIWDGKMWAPDETGEIKRRAKSTVLGIYRTAAATDDDDLRKQLNAHARTSEAKGKLEAMIALAESEQGIPVRLSDLDSDPWALNVHNGTIDLPSGELRPHRREDMNTKCAPVRYDATARSDLWESFLATATGGDGDLARYLQRAAGYALQGTVTEKAFFFLYGPPDTAKSTFVDAIMGALGTYAVAADFTTWLVQTGTGGNRGDLVRLAGTRLVTSVEVRPGVRFDQAIMKKVTGGDMITAAAKYEAEVSFPPAFALWLAANDAPAIRDDDDGMWNRVRRVPFDHVIPKENQDREMRTKLASQQVRAAILAWAVAGCIEWQRHGLGTCAAIDRSNAEYRKEMDRVAPFFTDCLVFEPGASIGNKVLRDTYEAWCRENGVKTPVTRDDLAKRLRDRAASPVKTNGMRGWRGVGLAPDQGPNRMVPVLPSTAAIASTGITN